MLEDKTAVMGENTVFISAKTGYGIDTLLSKITEALQAGVRQIKIEVPYKDAGVLNLIRQNGKILSEEYSETGIIAEAIADVVICEKLKEYIII